MKTAVALATVSVFAALTPVCAQDDEKAETGAEEAVPAPQKAERFFQTLLKCARVDGVLQVLRPNSANWENAEEGRLYPLGSSFRATDEVGALGGVGGEIEFGEKSSFLLTNASEVATAPGEMQSQIRGLVLRRGRVLVKLPRTLSEGAFTVKAPFFSCSNLAGESVFDYCETGDGDEAVVRCVTGSMALEGAHYKVARMGAANQVRIRTTGDNLFTSLRGESGDIKVVLDQGMGTQKNFETGEVSDVPRTLEFALSPQCAIKIWRKSTGASRRMAVSTMTFDSAGEMKNRCAFVEGRSFINSGELVIPPKAVEDAEKESVKSADKDAEETETVEAAPAKEKKNGEDEAKDDSEI